MDDPDHKVPSPETARPWASVSCGHWAEHVSFSPSETQLAVCSADTLQLWDCGTMTQTASLDHQDNIVWKCAFGTAADGMDFVSTGTSSGSVFVWNRRSLALETSMPRVHCGCVFGLNVHPKLRDILVTGGGDRLVRLLQVSRDTFNKKTSIRPLQTLEGHLASVEDVCVSPSGTLLASAAKDKRVILWTSVPENDQPTPLARQKSGCTLPIRRARRPRTAPNRVDSSTPTCGMRSTSSTLIRENRASSSTPSADSRATCSMGRQLYRAVSTVPAGEMRSTSSTLTADSRATSSMAHENRAINSMPTRANRVSSSTSASPDNNFVKFSSTTSLLKWTKQVLRGHRKWVLAVAFSPDSELLASASADKTLALWSVYKGLRLRVLRGHSNVVWGCRFVQVDPGSELQLMSCSSDRTLRFWDVKRGKELRRFEPGGATCVSSDRHSLGATSECVYSPGGTTEPNGHSPGGATAVSKHSTGGATSVSDPELSPDDASQILTCDFAPKRQLVVCGTFSGRICHLTFSNKEKNGAKASSL